jgi:hypothetical protein
MLTAIDPNAVWDYSLAEDSGEDKIIFKLGVLDGPLRGYIDDTHIAQSGTGDGRLMTPENITDKYIDFVRYGLRGWNGDLKDPSGNIITYAASEVDLPRVGKRRKVSEDIIKRFSLRQLVELGREINVGNIVTPEAQKSFS